MTADHFDAIFEAMLTRRPFRVFTIERYGGRCLEIDHRGALTFELGLAAFKAPGGILLLLDHESVRTIIDAPAVDVPNGPSR